MRGADEIRLSEQGRFLRRFGLEHVERRARDLPAIERIGQRRFVDQPAARAIDDPHALFGLGEVFAAENIARLVGQRRVQRDEIGARQQRVEIDLLDADLDGAFRRQEWIEGDHLHPETERA